MSGTKQSAGKAGKQSVRHFEVAPVARAVRLALAATTLALAGTGAAYAGTCSTSAGTTQCTGSFIDTLSFPAVVDLTLVVGDGGATPTSVTPGYGAAGIDVSGDGALNVTNDADVSTYGADGIHVYSTGSTSVTNNGSVTTYVDGIGQEGIDASANGNVTVSNNGNVTAYSDSSYDVTAVRAETVGCGCTATVNNGGSIVAYSSDASAIGVYAYAASGHADVDNGGSIRAMSYNGLADGVFAAGQDVDVSNSGYIDAEGVTWAAGIEAEGSDLTTVVNTGSIYASANGYLGQAFGIYAAGGDGGVSVTNSGTLYVEADYATGIDAHATGDVSVGNSAQIVSLSRYGYATGIHAGSNGDGAAVDVVNDGLVVANSYYGSTGIEVVATGAGASGSVTNTGTVYAGQQSKYGSSAGIVVSADGDAHVDNSGSIYVSQGSSYGPPLLTSEGFTSAIGGSAYGAMALSFNGDASLVNTGDIHVDATYGYAVGALAGSQNGNASVDNEGFVQTRAKYAYGVMATSGGGDVSVQNGADGVVYAESFVPLPYAFAAGLAGIATTGDTTIDNAGEVYAASFGVAVGTLGLSSQGDVTETNSGSVVAVAYYSTAIGMFGRADAGTASIDNSGNVSAYSYNGDAAGLLVRGDVAQVTNSGSVQAYGYYNAYGIEAVGATSANVTNDGDVVAYGSDTAIGVLGVATAGDATVGGSGTVEVYGGHVAIGLYANASGTATVNNGGSVSAYSEYGSAYGILAVGPNVDAGNTGDITVEAYGWAAGINVLGDVVNVTNDGSIQVTSTTSSGIAFGIYSNGTDASDTNTATIGNTGSITVLGTRVFGIYAGGGTQSVTNDGDITAGDTRTYVADGIRVATNLPYGASSVTNNGAITVLGERQATGISAFGYAVGSAIDVTNTGSLYAASNGKYGTAAGVLAFSDGDASVTNAGDISVVAGMGHGFGIRAASQHGSSVTVSNDGSVTSNAKYAYGVLATSNTGDVTIHGGADGAVYSIGALRSYGVIGYSTEGNVSIDNAGLVSAIGVQDAFGIYAGAGAGDVSVTNTGDISAVAGFGGAFGVYATAAQGTATVANGGTIDVASTSRAAMGIAAFGDGVVVTNDGSIVAHAYSEYGPTLTSQGAVVITGNPAFGILAYGTNVSVGSAGSIAAYAYGSAVGIVAIGDTVQVDNGGDIIAQSVYSAAEGISANGTSVTVANGGSIDVSSLGTFVSGIDAAGDTVAVTNSGDIAARGTDKVRGLSVGAFDTATLTNSGSVVATVDGDTGVAVGAEVFSYGAANVTNSGDISAVATGAGAAIGLLAQGNGVVKVDNSGTITASQTDYAVAVALNSATGSILTNHGTLRTYAGLEGQVAVRGGDNVEQVFNYGLIDGALVLNGGDDLVVNGDQGLWAVRNHATQFGAGDDTLANLAGGVVSIHGGAIDFGDGDDTIANGGVLQLDGGAISLGGSTAAGNRFINNGTIRVVGTGNTIDMGTGAATTLVPSLNPLPLVNNGVIDFVDGSPDDILTIAGDLDGQGRLQVDLRPLAHTSDLLYVDGNIVDGAVQTVDVDFGGRLTSAMVQGSTAFAHVAGAAADGSFVGGRVLGYSPSDFLALQVNVTSAVDAAGTDVFSVGVTADGLSHTGSVAAALAPGAQSMVNSLVGTWRQRTGVQLDNGTIGVSPWFRMFNDRGDISQDHVASNFGQGGTFGFDEANSGWELGLDIRPFAQLHAGLLIGESDGNQRLRETGSGDVGGQTFGLYGTWIGDQGFYVDASFRWIGLTGRVRADGTQQYTDGEADAFNVEAGFGAWSLPGDVLIQPQVQYTHTSLDFHPLVADLTTFDGRSANSSRGRVGVLFSKTITGNNGWTWVPYGSVNAIREFDGEYTYAINDDFVGATSTKGTSALVELGLGVHKDKVTVSGGLNWTDGGALNSFFGGQLVLRTTW